MIKFVIKRILLCIPILLGVSIVVFAILKFTPGDPARNKLGQDAPEEAVEALREEWGLNDNVVVQYLNYMKNLLRGDMGESYAKGSDVASDIAKRAKVTLPIVLLGMALAVIVGVPLGVYAAVKQYSIVDYTAQAVSLLLQAIPQFLLGSLLMLLFCLKLGWLPAVAGGNAASFILPIIAVCASGMAGIVRLTRSSMLEAIRADYVRTARAKGVKETKVIFRHCLQNALLPVLTTVGSSVGLTISGAVVVEAVFSMSGIGTYLRDGILGQDMPAVMGCVLFIAVITCLANLIVDVLYGIIDPRIKAKYIEG
jgi:peptide/nickel transport system permease protein